MSESKFETVSSLVDNYQTDENVFDELVKDNHMSETWQRYHLIGDTLRDELPQSLDLDLSATIAEAIAEEPTVLAPKAKASFTETVKAKVVEFAKPFGQVAIAASAAGLMVIGVQQNVAKDDSFTPNPVVQTIPFGGVAEPVSLNYQTNSRASQQQAMVEQQRRFQALLQDHKQQLKFTALASKESQQEKDNKEVTNTPK